MRNSVRRAIVASAFAAALLGGAAHAATTVTIIPTSDGALYTCMGCNPNPVQIYLDVAGYIQGDARFSTASIGGPVSYATLTVTPYAFPVGNDVDVYGYTASDGAITLADANQGVFLGTMTIADMLKDGPDLDITAFMASSIAPFVGFNLRTHGQQNGADILGSLQYGTPAQLTVTFAAVPEPATWAMMIVGFFGVGGLARRKARVLAA